MTKTIKQEILEYIREKSKQLKKDVLEWCTANAVSSQLSISRSLASQYLNDMVRENSLVKIKTRPVAFLSRYQLEKDSGKQIEQTDFSSYEELICFLYGAERNFEKIIGHEYALKDCIEKLKTSIHYPHGGLPILIYGSHGSGKTFLTDKIREYFLDKELIEREEQFIYLNCRNWDDTKFKHSLFGYIDTQNNTHSGALQKAKDGLVVLDDISYMGVEVQENLLHYLDRGTYHYANRNGEQLSSEARIVFVSDKEPSKVFTQHFLSRFPSVIEIPSLKDRTICEKMELVVHFFKRQAMLSSCEILLSDRLMEYLINQCSEYEVLFLKQSIILVFAKAFQQGKKQIRVGINHLSDHFYASDAYMEENYYPLEHFNRKEIDGYKYFRLELSSLFDRYQSKEIGKDAFYECLFQLLGKFNDAVIFNENYLERPLKRYESHIESISKLTEANTNIRISGFTRSILAKYLYMQSYFPEKDEPELNLKKIHSFLQEEHHNIFVYTKGFDEALEKNFGTVFSRTHMIVFLLDLLLYSNDMTNKQTLALIICHGNATASSIAAVVNTLLSSHVFDAFDMPLSSDVSSMLLKVKDYLCHKQMFENLLLIVDMGSLTGIAEELKAFQDVNILLIDTASTPLALCVGTLLLQGSSLEDIVEYLATVKTECKIIPKSNKEKAILFTSENGTNAADKMRLLFEKSIPVQVDIRLISCDYLHLVGEKKQHFLNKYDILFIEGIVDPGIPGIEFINLGEIVNFQAMERINRILEEFLNRDDMEVFQRNLLKNFSLENLVESLTILNPGPLLNLVEEAMHRLMQLIGYKIPEKTLISLYVHVCCFVERMVTRNPIETYYSLEHFQKEKAEYIQHFQSSFEKITKHYNIEIPISEVAYIYDYIETSKGNSAQFT